MKFHVLTAVLLSLVLLAACSKDSGPVPSGATTDSVTVTVINGYGSGKYKVGDTVNIWSEAIPTGSVFDTWIGYNHLLENAGEWHNSFIVPSENVTVTASLQSLASFKLTHEMIKGINVSKNVYYYFPTSQKGIVYLLHGTGGNVQNLVNNFEWITMINDLVAAGYAIVVTEAEEVSLNKDTNKDGYVRWNLAPLDTVNNPDYGNFRALADTFYTRGYTKRSIPKYSIGMSDGGAFSAALSFAYHFAGGVSYCAPTSTAVTNTSTTPFQFCMAKYDNNPEVGPTGDATAQTNSNALTGRGICSRFFLHDRSPVYPQRFAHWSGISLSTSATLYNELKVNNWLNSKNFLTAPADTISARILANPSAYPVTSALNLGQYTYYTNELDIMYGNHQFYSDYDKTTIHFLEAGCK